MAYASNERTGPKVIKLFSCSTQLSMKFIMFINVKMPRIVGILTFINLINITPEMLKANMQYDQSLLFSHTQSRNIQEGPGFIFIAIIWLLVFYVSSVCRHVRDCGISCACYMKPV